MVGLFYKAVPVLADEDKIGGSAILASGTIGVEVAGRCSYYTGAAGVE